MCDEQTESEKRCCQDKERRVRWNVERGMSGEKKSVREKERKKAGRGGCGG